MDLPNYMWLSLIYHFVEVPVAVICCCMPALPPVIDKVKMSSLGSYTRSVFSKGSKSSLGNSKKSSENGSNKSETKAGIFQKMGSANSSAVNTQARKPSDEIPLGEHEIGVKHAYDVSYQETRL